MNTGIMLLGISFSFETFGVPKVPLVICFTILLIVAMTTDVINLINKIQTNREER